MEDSGIVALYWARSEQAIEETAKKYGDYCFSIACRILASREDADEAVNDTYMGAWNSMPPHRPAILSTFLGKIARRTALKRWEAHRAEKRGGGELPLVLEELANCLPAAGDPAGEAEARELARAINAFVHSLPKIQRQVFVCRYWYLDPLEDICRRFGFSRSKVKSMLYRTREKLKQHLEKEELFHES